MNHPTSIPSIFTAKNGYGRLINFAGYTERSSEDNEKWGRADQSVEEKKNLR